MAYHMNQVAFKYKIVPYARDSVGKIDGFSIPHTDMDVIKEGLDDRDTTGQYSDAELEFQNTLRSIYYYQQSYFRDNQV
jgi:hypothetical protein